MTDYIRPLVERVEDLLVGVSGAVVLRWGTVTSADPLRVRLDADGDPLPFKPAAAPKGLRVGDRVRCSIQNLRVTVEAVAGRGPASQAEVNEGTDTTRYVTPKTLRDRGSTGTLTLLRGVLPASRAQSLTKKDGMVTLIMHLENGNGLTLSASYQEIAILPDGYRPPKEMAFPGVSPGSTAATVICNITAAGTLRVAVSGNVAAGIAVTYPI